MNRYRGLFFSTLMALLICVSFLFIAVDFQIHQIEILQEQKAELQVQLFRAESNSYHYQQMAGKYFMKWHGGHGCEITVMPTPVMMEDLKP